MRVYVCGPYSSDPERNTLAAIQAAHKLMNHGHRPFCPHLSHFMEAVRSRPYEEWMALDFAFLDVCHAVVRLPGHSPGADREAARAHMLGIPVYHGIESFLNFCEEARR